MNVNLLPLAFGILMSLLGIRYLVVISNDFGYAVTKGDWIRIVRDSIFAMIAYLVAGSAFALSFSFSYDPKYVPAGYVLILIALGSGVGLVVSARNGILWLAAIATGLLLMVGATQAPT